LAGKTSPSILILYPSCFYYPVWMERVEIKTSQLWLSSYLNRFFPVTYADFEIEIGRPNSPTQVKRFERKARRFLENHDFDILAISCWTSLSYLATLTTARICRELYPDKLIVVGGYHPSARPEEFITDDNTIDYIITREGELALKGIAEEFNGSGRPDKPQVISGPMVSADDFVDYDWRLVEDFYRRNFPDGIDNTCIYLSRGCPFGCSFCMEPFKERRWRSFSPAQAVDDVIDLARRFDLYSVAIADACFGLRPSWRKEFLNRLVEREPDFWLVFETRPEYLDAEDIEIISRLKVEIQFGIESGSPDMLRIMKKTRQPEKFLKHFSDISHRLTEHKILHRANMIFNHPGETRRTLQDTMAFMDGELALDNSYLIWAIHGFMHFPGCEIDVNRQYYEETFGSRFISGDWWKIEEDQYERSQQFIPSRDLDGDHVRMWEDLIEERDGRMRESLAQPAFEFAARKYYSRWLNDYRYAHR